MSRMLIVIAIGGLFTAVNLSDFAATAQEVHGQWRVISSDHGLGENKELYEGYHFTFARGVLIIRDTNSDQAGVACLGLPRSYRVNTDESPPHIDFPPDRSNGQATVGIFRLEDDQLTLCIRFGNDQQRPAEFKAIRDPRRAQNHTILYVLKRVAE